MEFSLVGDIFLKWLVFSFPGTMLQRVQLKFRSCIETGRKNVGNDGHIAEVIQQLVQNLLCKSAKKSMHSFRSVLVYDFVHYFLCHDGMLCHDGET